MGFNNPNMPWWELEATLSDHSADRPVPSRGRDGRAPGSPSWNAGGDGPAWSRKRQPYEAPADVDRTKPHPDLIAAAAERLPEVSDFVVIGDTAWDAVAAGRAGFPAIGVLSGGFGASELRDAGCIAVFVDAADLAAHLESALDTARSARAAAAR